MHHLIGLPVVATLVLALMLGCSPPAPPMDPGDPETQSQNASALHARISSLLDEAEIPGLQVAVIEDGALAWGAEFGVRSVETQAPVEADTVFEAASLSKPVLAYLVLGMVARGELDLDAELIALLPYARFDDEKRARALTPRLVLSHQTGLPNWGGDPLVFEADPGSGFGYSGEGYVYLQRVVEAATGTPLETLAEREVFTPLGMTHSAFVAVDDLERATGHDASGNAIPRATTEANAASSLYTTARDYARFVAAWMAPDDAARDRATLSLRPTVNLAGDERGGPTGSTGNLAWGLGWGLQVPAVHGAGDDGAGDDTVVWHWGDNGIFRAFVAWRPVDGRGIVYFANSVNGLAVAEAILEPTVGTVSPIIRWLEYEQSTAPTWAPRRAALRAQAAGDFDTAIVQFERLLAIDPEDEGTHDRVAWLRDLARVTAAPTMVPPERLARYAGRYGPRVLTLDGDTLRYQRGDGPVFPLVPIDQRTFMLEGMAEFKLEVAIDDDGVPIKLIGHYLGGRSDESIRDPESSD